VVEPVDIWRAYRRPDNDRVKGTPVRALSDIVMLVRWVSALRRRWSRRPAIIVAEIVEKSGRGARPFP
jgi:type I restriction enzyme, R subunit